MAVYFLITQRGSPRSAAAVALLSRTPLDVTAREQGQTCWTAPQVVPWAGLKSKSWRVLDRYVNRVRSVAEFGGSIGSGLTERWLSKHPRRPLNKSANVELFPSVSYSRPNCSSSSPYAVREGEEPLPFLQLVSFPPSSFLCPSLARLLMITWFNISFHLHFSLSRFWLIYLTWSSHCIVIPAVILWIAVLSPWTRRLLFSAPPILWEWSSYRSAYAHEEILRLRWTSSRLRRR